jgi:surface polysaccharide O-acyltransferase-like enzyme
MPTNYKSAIYPPQEIGEASRALSAGVAIVDQQGFETTPSTNATINQPATKARIEYIDTLRVIACFLVILTHSSRPVDDHSLGIWLGLLSFIGSPSSELFLSLSGTVLLPVKTSIGKFYRRRFMKLVPPVVFWSVVVMLTYHALGTITTDDMISRLILIPFQPVIGVYWFVYAIIGLYLLAPFLSKWLSVSTDKELRFVLFLWGINMLLPYLNLLPVNATFSNDSHYWELNYFSGFLGYWLLGYYLRKNPVKIGLNRRWLTIVTGSLGYVAVLGALKIYGMNLEPYMDNLQIGSAFLVALIYTLAQSLPIGSRAIRSAITEVARYSFGIYLVHILVTRELVWSLFEGFTIHPLADTLVIATLSMTISYGIVKALGHLPFSKYTIGV